MLITGEARRLASQPRPYALTGPGGSLWRGWPVCWHIQGLPGPLPPDASRFLPPPAVSTPWPGLLHGVLARDLACIRVRPCSAGGCSVHSVPLQHLPPLPFPEINQMSAVKKRCLKARSLKSSLTRPLGLWLVPCVRVLEGPGHSARGLWSRAQNGVCWLEGRRGRGVRAGPHGTLLGHSSPSSHGERELAPPPSRPAPHSRFRMAP